MRHLNLDILCILRSESHAKESQEPGFERLGGTPTGALTEFEICSTDSARYRSNARETGVARQPQWVEKAAV